MVSHALLVVPPVVLVYGDAVRAQSHADLVLHCFGETQETAVEFYGEVVLFTALVDHAEEE